MKLPTLIVTGLCIAPFVMADPDPQQNQKSFGDCLPKYLKQYDVKGGPSGPNGQPTGDGKLDQDEVQAMKRLREQKRVEQKNSFDTNGDGAVCDQEREQAKLQIRQAIEEHRLMRFDEADTDPPGGDGYLTWDEWIVLPGVARKLAIDPVRVAEIFDRLDADDDQLISKDEFMTAVRQCDRDRDGSGDGKQTGRGGTNGGGGGGGSGGS